MRMRRTIAFVVLSLCIAWHAQAQTTDTQPVKRYEVSGGIMRELTPDSIGMAADSLLSHMDSLTLDSLSKREIRRLRRDTIERYNFFLRDTMPVSRMTAVSMVLPGFSQLHNKQAWKIPVAWGTIGAAVYMGMQENNCFQKAKSHYDRLVYYGYNRSNSDMDEAQRIMLKYNTRRQLYFGAAAAAYIYFLSDGLMNYPGGATNVKIATTLSTICPGAGQIYNKSYWKAPIVLGSFATMIMMIDWNNRGYNRFKLAYNLKMAGRNDAVERVLQQRPASEMLDYRKAYRRNRDLCIILAGAVYLLNLVDAHVDAYMQTFDVSDDLGKLDIAFAPKFTNVTTLGGGSVGAVGFSMSMKF